MAQPKRARRRSQGTSDEEIFNVVMKYFNKASDATAEFMVWPDARLRSFLRARCVSEPKKVKRQRPDLVVRVAVLASRMNGLMRWIAYGTGKVEAEADYDSKLGKAATKCVDEWRRLVGRTITGYAGDLG
jgi:hypothetical protein